MQFALSDQVQTSDEIDFDAVKVVLDRFVPTRSFFVFQFFKTQYFLENKETEEALKAFDVILNNPEKVAYTELCNAMMGFGQTLHEIGKLEAYFTKFDKIEVQAKDANLIYLKDFVKAIVYIKTKQNSKFKETANLMLASNTTPQEVKRDLKLAMQNVEN